ncbi:PepSY domain-containing protein [Herbaspirillum autotrophicum]|uniref:PepSY domain-containing protein n=1 Tax=Herbaspirillum autotrophicum TaxID=180195 RepID=UPI00067D6D78|nr:PepSY domain-containing protein [Herbaspirillum autotrophicum]
MKFTPTLLSLCLAGGIAFAPMAHAKESDAAKYTRYTAQAKISLADAIAKANEKVAGTPVEAELDRDRGVIVFKIKILNENQLTKVLVDPQTGAIISSYVSH